MSAEIAAEGRHGAAGKKSRLLPAETKLMSGKIAGDFADERGVLSSAW